MLTDNEIAVIALEVARHRFGADNVETIESAGTLDADGEEAIEVNIVIRDGTLDRAGDDAIADTLVDVRAALEEKGEKRFPYVRYVTREELAFHGDP